MHTRNATHNNDYFLQIIWKAERWNSKGIHLKKYYDNYILSYLRKKKDFELKFKKEKNEKHNIFRLR